MKNLALVGMRCIIVSFACICTMGALAWAQEGVIGFDTNRWDAKDAVIVDYLGRKCMMGHATLKNVQFENGVIEVDVAVDGRATYPGIVFRMADEGNFERVYIRPHRAGRYPDAVQYTPNFNGFEEWQLCNGTGFTAAADIPQNEWVHLKLEVQGTRARVFVGNADRPTLIVNDLRRGVSKGVIGLVCNRDKRAYFSNFSYRLDDSLDFGAAPLADAPPGIVGEWMISQPFKMSEVDMERSPAAQGITDIEWRQVTSEPSGLVDIARYVEKSGAEPPCVFAKTTLSADRAKLQKLRLGYSDIVSVFLNGKMLFGGNSSYRFRDPSFLGIVGYFDAVYLPLKKGGNELLLMVAETFGGWGFMCQLGDATYSSAGIKKLWETPHDFLTPESVVYDPARKVFYVSNYDIYNVNYLGGKQFISRVAPDGAIEDLEWITGVSNPTGMAVVDDKLFVVERRSVAEIDLNTGQIAKRHPIPTAMLPNDIAVDAAGTMYVSDSYRNCIFKIAAGQCEEWLTGDDVRRPNGICFSGGTLIFSNNEECALKSIDPATKEVRTIVRWTSGTIDGLASDADGNLLVSHNEGRLYRVSPSGEVTKLLDTSVPGINSADFAYVPEKGLVVIPTFGGNSVAAYTLK
jgi:sugar lactone lactonase YvrE